MLRTLTIQNYALISHLEIDFSDGFSVITGETGAGKSIILGALSLILGQRADTKVIRHSEKKCYIEGVFNISSYQLKDFFVEKELEYDSEVCILRREIWPNGKSRAFINDSPVTLGDLKDLGSFLIDVHSQHQNLLLNDNLFQLQVLDVLAKNQSLRQSYEDSYKMYVGHEKRLRDLKAKAKTHSDEEDYLRFQFSQLDDAGLVEGEQEELEEEIKVLSNMEEIKSLFYRIEQNLSSDENGVLSALKDSLNASQSLSNIYSDVYHERIETAYLDLKDLAQEIASKQESLDLDPDRLQTVKERLDIIYSLQQKHKLTSVEELIELRDNINRQLQEINNYDEQVAMLEKELIQMYEALMKQAKELSKTREKASKILEKSLVQSVSNLGMPNMQFKVDIKTKERPDERGIDQVSYLFSANKNGDMHAVAQIASGGEISRLMLGIKSLIAGVSALPTIIFDEIDTGVSGEIADKMGKIMYDMGQDMQVITITHLPQIAAHGGSHFFVYKQDNSENTETNIRLLNNTERIKEIAHMLSGSDLTDAAIENAKELLKKK
ncbi:DNA repair protein RecN [Bacteroidales bacterium OttesenSCG-928-I14]|nr:DNA repair protein RecN [Bacteroidales bacterium OttesenSCG-928-I14]